MRMFDSDAKKIVYFISRFIIIFSSITWLLTECLGDFGLLTSKVVTMAWGIVGIIFLFILFLYYKKNGKKVKDNCFGVGYVKALCADLQKSEYIMIFLGLSIAFGLFFIAYVTVPFNWDSMTYHLARVGNWIQNASVEHYPTNIERQLYYSSFTEYYILHICLIFRSDKLVNLVQWCGYIASTMMVYGIADELGMKRKVALFSSLLFMLCPLTIAESSTTQVDLIGTMWVLIFAYYVLLIGKRNGSLLQKENLIHIVCCGAAIGFGYLTKASICFMMPVLLVWLLGSCLKRREQIKAMLICCIVAAGIILMLAMPGFARNYKSTGNILAMNQTAGNLMLEIWNPKYIFLNFCKNMTMEVAGSKEPDMFWTMTMNLAEVMGVDIEDPEISAYHGFSEGVTKSHTQDKAGAQSLFVMTEILLLIIFIKWIWNGIKDKKLFESCSIENSYVVAGMCSVLVLFCCIRWQHWGTRLLLPALPILCIFVGYIVDRLKKQYIQTIFLVVAVLLMLPDAALAVKGVCQYAKPAIENQDRFYLYFLNRGEAREYEALCNEIQKLEVQNIGMFLDEDTYEWPLWVKLKNENTVLRHIVIGQENITWYPECIIAINRNVSRGQMFQYGEREYECIWNYENDDRFAILVEKK